MEGEVSFLKIRFRQGIEKYNIIILFLMCFFAMLMNIAPTMLIPTYLQETIHISRQHLGKINASLSVIVEIMIICFVGAIGILSDKKGRRILLVGGFFTAGVFSLLFGSSHILSDLTGIENPIFFIYFFRTLLGLSLLFVWPQVQSLITDYTYVDGRGKAMAVMGFMYTSASLFSFLFLARLPQYIGLYNVFIIIMILGILASITSRIGLVDLINIEKHKKVDWKEVLKLLKKSPCLKITFSTAFASRADVVILAMFIMIWVNKEARAFGKTPFQAMAEGGITIALASIVGLLCYPLWGYLVERIGRLRVLVIGLTFAGLGYVLIGLISNPFSIWMKVCVFIFALGVNGSGVGASTLTSDLAPRNIIGSLLGGYHTAAAIGIMFFLQVGGFLFDYLGHSSPFVLTGIADLAVVLFALFTWKKAHKEEKGIRNSKYSS
ncbi:MAG: MFS transporter [Candidatus Schekmanbacteria bacterium]|nr:MAG: MFS transporter [Candidatus Schekmanbacteria bacterium]